MKSTKNISQPIIQKIEDNSSSFNVYADEIAEKTGDSKTKIICDFPTVYIHQWKDSNEYEVYVGESDDFIRRTRQHYSTGEKKKDSWQNHIKGKDAWLYVIGHEHFNKSLTLDVENRMMQYLLSAPNVKKVHNLRGNPQRAYYTSDEFDAIFTKIWRGLRRDDNVLFPTESSIKDSAIFKASPLHKLTTEQIEAREHILDRVKTALDNNERGQIIFVEGEAGTGKTVLTSSTLYELFCRTEEPDEADEDLRGVENDLSAYNGLSFAMIVNHEEQITVYEQICEKLGMSSGKREVVYRPTRFINTHSPNNPIDVAFIDEAHLLWTQGKQSYRGKNQLQDIIDRARVTVVMFDEYQILTTEQYWEAKELAYYKDLAKSKGNHIELKTQLRMHADEKVISWIDNFTKNRKLLNIPESDIGYKIVVCKSPEELDKNIRKKASKPETALSRVIATFDWEYDSTGKSGANIYSYYNCVKIGNWSKPWNKEIERKMPPKEKKGIKKLAWAEQPQTIDEVGSTYTIQGFDLNYAGVILGKSVTYKDGMIDFEPKNSCSSKATRKRTLSDGTMSSFGKTLLQHELRVLMTRGVNGIYVYADDPKLQEALLKASIGGLNDE